MVTVSFILSFYAIVSGWMLAFLLAPITQLLGWDSATLWLTTDGVLRNSLFVVLFAFLTILIISAGVKDGIEKWATRLMPSLVLILALLIGYVLTLPGAMDGLRAYLVPDFSALTQPGLLVSAMGQAFFSLSLGVGTMLVYGSYISKDENLPVIGSLVALLDVGMLHETNEWLTEQLAWRGVGPGGSPSHRPLGRQRSKSASPEAAASVRAGKTKEDSSREKLTKSLPVPAQADADEARSRESAMARAASLRV